MKLYGWKKSSSKNIYIEFSNKRGIQLENISSSTTKKFGKSQIVTGQKREMVEEVNID